MKCIYILLVTIFLMSCMSSANVVYEDPVSQDVIEESLFSSDTDVLSNEAVQKILEGTISYPDNIRIVILKIPNTRNDIRYYGYYYWRSEEYIDLQEEYNTIMTDTFAGNDKIETVKILPSIMIPQKITIPNMREAAVRMQADALVVYKIQSDIFEKFRLFRHNQVKAFATCESFLLDTKSGIIPFSTVITEKYLTEKIKDDADGLETKKRAEKEAIKLSLQKLCIQINKFLLDL